MFANWDLFNFLRIKRQGFIFDGRVKIIFHLCSVYYWLIKGKSRQKQFMLLGKTPRVIHPLSPLLREWLTLSAG